MEERLAVLVHADLLLHCIRARYRTAAARLCRLAQPVDCRLICLTWLLCLPARLSARACLLGAELLDNCCPALFGRPACAEADEAVRRLRHLLARCHLMLLLDSGRVPLHDLLASLNRLFPPQADPSFARSADIASSRSRQFRQSFLWLFLVPGRSDEFLAETWRKREARRSAGAIELAVANCLRGLPASALFDFPEDGERSAAGRQRADEALLRSAELLSASADARLIRLSDSLRYRRPLLQDDILAYIDDLSGASCPLPDGLCLTATMNADVTDDDQDAGDAAVAAAGTSTVFVTAADLPSQ